MLAGYGVLEIMLFFLNREISY